VVFDWRRTGGSSRSAWSRATFWLLIDLNAVVALETALDSA
jgi:hypothetical protein